MLTQPMPKPIKLPCKVEPFYQMLNKISKLMVACVQDNPETQQQVERLHFAILEVEISLQEPDIITNDVSDDINKFQ